MPIANGYIWLMHLLVISSLHIGMAGHKIPLSGPSTMRPEGTFVKKPELIGHNNGPVLGGPEAIKNCKPNGLRHTSAPSRYVNYRPLGSCSTVHPNP